MGLYAALALAATLFLSGEARLVVWIFLGGLAAKTWITWKRRSLEDRDRRD